MRLSRLLCVLTLWVHLSQCKQEPVAWQSRDDRMEEKTHWFLPDFLALPHRLKNHWIRKQALGFRAALQSTQGWTRRTHSVRGPRFHCSRHLPQQWPSWLNCSNTTSPAPKCWPLSPRASASLRRTMKGFQLLKSA